VQEYPENLELRGVDIDTLDNFEQQQADFDLKARRLVHIGEVAYKDGIEPLSLAVSQTFKIEKVFDCDDLGCTQAVHDVVAPLLPGLSLQFKLNSTSVTLPGQASPTPTYYIGRR